MDYILYHHGIKGMRWGVRRFQKKDGTLTPAGRKRYTDDKTPSKTTHRDRLEEKYRSRGMSSEEAKLAADKRIKAEKIVAITAGITVAAATAYVANKYIKERADGVIKAGTKLQVIADTPDKNIDRAFYTAYKDGDKTRYKGLYGYQINQTGRSAYKISLNTDQDVKIVSRKKAADTFADLYKNDPDFRSAFEQSNRSLSVGVRNPNQRKVLNAANKAMTDKQLRKSGYDAFNIGLANHDQNGNAIAKKFYDRLKEQGYDAVIDINDQKYSGYGSKKPVIVFNRANKISISEAKQMTHQQIMSNVEKVQNENARKELVKSGTAYAAVYAATTTASVYVDLKLRSIQVDNYRKEHPGTKMSDKEILKALGH